HPVAQVLKHFVLPSLWLQQQRIPKRAETAAEQIKLCFPIEFVPISQHHLPVSQLRLPLLLPIRTQAAWDNHPDKPDEPPMRSHIQALAIPAGALPADQPWSRAAPASHMR